MVQMNSVKMVYDSSGTEALHGVDLDIHDGEFVFLVAPSRPGKPTIIKLLTGEVHAHNTFDDPNAVHTTDFTGFTVEGDTISAELPACSVVLYTIEA